MTLPIQLQALAVSVHSEVLGLSGEEERKERVEGREVKDERGREGAHLIIVWKETVMLAE